MNTAAAPTSQLDKLRAAFEANGWDQADLDGMRMQMAPAQEAGRAQPQTTVEPPGGPFIRHSQPGRRAGYTHTGVAFGGTVTDPIPAASGYFKGFRTKVAATGGVNGSVTVAAQADAPFSCVALVQLKDAFGTALVVGPGYEMLYLVPMLGGQYGLDSAADIKNMPSYSAPSTGGAGTGNFTFATYLPLEIAKGYGVISGANSALLPTLQWNMAASSAVYSTAPGTVPTMQFDVNPDFYWLPDGVDQAPPGLGTTEQWVLQQATPTFSASTSLALTFPRLGGFLSTIIMVLRDSTGARVDAWPTTGRLQLIVDGVPLIDSLWSELQDDFYNMFGGITRPTGVMAISRKTSLNQKSLGLMDTGETYLSTNPGTQVQVAAYPWGSGGTGPYTLNVIAGQVVPSGSLIQGLPEV